MKDYFCKFLIPLFALIVIAIGIVAMAVGLLPTRECQGEEKQKSYFQYPPSKTLKPMSFWNPLLTFEKGKLKSKSYFKYPTLIFPGGSLFNPIITIKEKKKGEEQ